MVTIHCEVLAKEKDIYNYQTLVVKDLDNTNFGEHYRMLSVWPNWESRIPEIGEVGYLTYEYARAGIDKYYDKNLGKFIVYNFTNFIFIKFVKEQDNSIKDIIL